ncbi:hypothetical protein SAMN05216554_3577 [Herbiconiux ginsengi]|uniref:Uncharacterized protein n=1 Tax=Herbiconiux ginsengi TaxID=381665 RepID=A0A1H3SPY7_9MICO|nr:hypothetical protein SAMN05216554_3577 [Herbiconiux ginsengi]
MPTPSTVAETPTVAIPRASTAHAVSETPSADASIAAASQGEPATRPDAVSAAASAAASAAP